MQGNFPLYHSRKPDIVCFSLSRWNAAISSPAVSLAKEFSKHHRVFFISHPYTYKDIFTGNREQRTAERWPNITVVEPSSVLPINFLPRGGIYNYFSSVNNAILLRELRRTIAGHGIREYIFINFFDPFFLRRIPTGIAPMKYVYQCMDDMSQVAYTHRHGVELENEIVRTADAVLCTSTELTRLKSAISSKVHFHPNAADFELFHTALTSAYARPPDLPVGKKIVGFTGSIEYRTDFELLKKAATAHTDKIFFLIGPVAGTEHLQQGLDKLPNVKFAGAIPISELPAYLRYFDCCIIPYKKNQLTASIYPLKINEYLAAGKPVVATSFSEDILSFARVAHIAGDHDSFVRLIDTAMADNDASQVDARVRAAAENTWEKRVEAFWKLI